MERTEVKFRAGDGVVEVMALQLIAGTTWTRESIGTPDGMAWATRERPAILDTVADGLAALQRLSEAAAEAAWEKYLSELTIDTGPYPPRAADLERADSNAPRAAHLTGEVQTLTDAGPSGSPGAGVRIGLHGSGPDWGGA